MRFWSPQSTHFIDFRFRRDWHDRMIQQKRWASITKARSGLLKNKIDKKRTFYTSQGVAVYLNRTDAGLGICRRIWWRPDRVRLGMARRDTEHESLRPTQRQSGGGERQLAKPCWMASPDRDRAIQAPACRIERRPRYPALAPSSSHKGSGTSCRRIVFAGGSRSIPKAARRTASRSNGTRPPSRRLGFTFGKKGRSGRRGKPFGDQNLLSCRATIRLDIRFLVSNILTCTYTFWKVFDERPWDFGVAEG